MLSDCGNSILYNAKLRSTALEAAAYGEFNIVTDIYLKSNRNILFGDKKASVQKSPDTFEPANSRNAWTLLRQITQQL